LGKKGGGHRWYWYPYRSLELNRVTILVYGIRVQTLSVSSCSTLDLDEICDIKDDLYRKKNLGDFFCIVSFLSEILLMYVSRAVWWGTALLTMTVTLAGYGGLIIAAKYTDCDPVLVKVPLSNIMIVVLTN